MLLLALPAGAASVSDILEGFHLEIPTGWQEVPLEPGLRCTTSPDHQSFCILVGLAEPTPENIIARLKKMLPQLTLAPCGAWQGNGVSGAVYEGRDQSGDELCWVRLLTFPQGGVLFETASPHPGPFAVTCNEIARTISLAPVETGRPGLLPSQSATFQALYRRNTEGYDSLRAVAQKQADAFRALTERATANDMLRIQIDLIFCHTNLTKAAALMEEVVKTGEATPAQIRWCMQCRQIALKDAVEAESLAAQSKETARVLSRSNPLYKGPLEQTCPTCGGIGFVTTSWEYSGSFMTETYNPSTGKFEKTHVYQTRTLKPNPCPGCGGSGKIKRR